MLEENQFNKFSVFNVNNFRKPKFKGFQDLEFLFLTLVVTEKCMGVWAIKQYEHFSCCLGRLFTRNLKPFPILYREKNKNWIYFNDYLFRKVLK